MVMYWVSLDLWTRFHPWGNDKIIDLLFIFTNSLLPRQLVTKSQLVPSGWCVGGGVCLQTELLQKSAYPVNKSRNLNWPIHSLINIPTTKANQETFREVNKAP